MSKYLDGASSYRSDIDGLRAIAVISVVLFHAGLPGFSGGFVGVDIFFVISGYLITGIIWRQHLEGRFSLADFYVRRIRRIFPALFAMLATCMIAALFLLTPADLVAFGKSLNATVLFYANMHFIKQTGYFSAPAIDMPLLHTWSLSVEEQFYAVWPLLFLAMVRLLPRKILLYSTLALAAVSLLLAQQRMVEYPKDAFFVTYYRMWELLIGAALALAPALIVGRRGALAMAVAGVGMIAISITLYNSTIPFPGATALLPCIGTALIIAAGRTRNLVSSMLSTAPLRGIGLISFSLYLVHWPLFSFSHLYLNRELGMNESLLLVALSFILAWVSWRFVETPFRLSAKPPRALTFAYGGSAAAVLCALGFTVVAYGGFPSRVDETVVTLERFALSEADRLGKLCRTTNAAAGVNADWICEVGETRKGSYDFVVWGDSHARHASPAFDMLGRQAQLSGIVIAQSACGDLFHSTGSKCGEFSRTSLEWILNHPTLRTVVLAARWSLTGRLFKRSNETHESNLTNLIGQLRSKGLQVVVLGQIPEVPEALSKCVARAKFYQRDESACSVISRSDVEKRIAVATSFFKSENLKGNLIYVDTLPIFCDELKCDMRQQGQLLLSDSNHLSLAGAKHLGLKLKIPALATEPRVVDATVKGPVTFAQPQ
ncbi:acyltransferase family protein [Rhodomicrobium lacus]|uniref:acyltransferase family protein n=1 Tax=Rhodomicrobium lacus TaxID=2498452 RepID=UPI0026E3707B|nr:acyltransferase family protein [Rhodomicrobium lacus]WKW50105.1 acyltransferase family protein [Rhodomicrobium lacus]